MSESQARKLARQTFDRFDKRIVEATNDLTQQEPLGQLGSLNDPAALPDPTGNQTYLGYASDPAWQCAAGRDFYGSFSAMPFHCQLKMIMDLRNTLEDIYGPEKTPNDPKAVPRDIVDSPIPAEYSPDQGNSYASKAMMSVALISTSKPDKKKKGKTVKGGELAYIEVRAGSDMIDMSDSGWSSPDSGPASSSDPFVKFRSDVRLSDEDCDQQLSKIFGGVAKAMEGAGDLFGENRYVNNGVYIPGHSATPFNNKPVTEWFDDNGNGRRDPGEIVKDLQRGGIIHTYTNYIGAQRTDIPLTAPGGWTAAYSDFQAGNSIIGIRYSNGITIEFIHAGTTNKNNKPDIPKRGNRGSLVNIGYVGGAGSAYGEVYHHTHIVFYSDKKTYTTVDPRKLFCGW